jgi:hypothetical protein
LNEASLDDLRDELATLEAAETRISATRRQLHHQIDFGYATAARRAREREVSDERRQLHQRIDLLRELLRARDPLANSDKESTTPEPSISPLSQWSGISPEAARVDDAFAEELEQ